MVDELSTANPPEPSPAQDDDADARISFRANAFALGEHPLPAWSWPLPRRSGLSSYTVWPDEA